MVTCEHGVLLVTWHMGSWSMCTCGGEGDNATRDYQGHVNPVHIRWTAVGLGGCCETSVSARKYRHNATQRQKKLMIERFMHYVEMVPESGCWVWMASLNSFGYGQFGLREPVRRPYPAHRVSYVIHHGPIEPGLVIDHKCRVRACVNPNHLQMVTQAQNMELAVFARTAGSGGTAGENRRKTCCPKCGGDYSLNSQGWRICKPCVKKREQARYREKKNARPT